VGIRAVKLIFSFKKTKKIRDLFIYVFSTANWLIFDHDRERPVLYSFQRIANTLSTEAPTDFGGNFSAVVENR
jgi:hypothetical protein